MGQSRTILAHMLKAQTSFPLLGCILIDVIEKYLLLLKLFKRPITFLVFAKHSKSVFEQSLRVNLPLLLQHQEGEVPRAQAAAPVIYLIGQVLQL